MRAFPAGSNAMAAEERHRKLGLFLFSNLRYLHREGIACCLTANSESFDTGRLIRHKVCRENDQAEEKALQFQVISSADFLSIDVSSQIPKAQAPLHMCLACRARNGSVNRFSLTKKGWPPVVIEEHPRITDRCLLATVKPAGPEPVPVNEPALLQGTLLKY